ncbi:SpaH/EbpB family LPXTG-anchored major pilin [Gardnerella greenwoodii]|uniref:Peptidase n=1 Tax=Gardnerella greenwoodii TaxID=2914925 RepID=A0A2N6RYG2_9BIFI|nr:SpaH/EbpB family LPXTG-anchored major pilin [Gardnerella greenwoodii]MDF0753428.1 SpaH/EbpB family LPXTG-anchored major pilin [Gardnerella greenwoodii]PMC43150.1 peptidase [Gardnerella greenwoodii]
MNNFTKRCVAAFASLTMAGTLCAAGAVTVSSIAWASKPVVPQDTSKDNTGDNPSQPVESGKAPWELGDEASTKTGSITIYKWEDEVDSTSKKQLKKNPVKGAKFTVKKATNIDLTKYSDWVTIAQKINDFNAGKEKPDGITFEDNGTEKDTDGTATGTKAGVAKFDSLKIGLYQVKETTVPKGYSASESKPFYITIPMIEKGDGDKVVYNYNPSVDPKNKNLKKCVKKKANTDGAIGAGDEVKYTITSELTKMKNSATDTDLTANDFDDYSVVDLAPAGYFKYPDDISNVVKKVRLGIGNEAKAGDTELTATDDYTVAKDANQITAAGGDVARDKITISFTPAGKGKLATEANKTDNVGKPVKVFVDLAFTLADSTKIQNKTVENKGAFTHKSDSSPIVGDETAKIEFVKFSIKKVSAKDTTKTLPGAKFKMFDTEAAAKTCSDAITSGSGVDTACKTAHASFDEKETAESTDSTKGTEKGVTQSYSVIKGKSFFILETEAPAGYIRDPEPVAVTDTNADKELTFKDVPDDSDKSWFNLLPKTGAAGVILFALAGVCFVVAGFVVYIHRRKKEEEQAKLRA